MGMHRPSSRGHPRLSERERGAGLLPGHARPRPSGGDEVRRCRALPAARSASRPPMTWDILIRGGTIIDGSGRPGAISDIAVRDGRIAALGRSLPAGSTKVIDAEGLAVAPGFIDIKTHSDFTLPINPKAESKVRPAVPTRIIRPFTVSL